MRSARNSPTEPDSDIRTARLLLVRFDRPALEAILSGKDAHGRFRWPRWWPDDTDRTHVELWLRNATPAGRPTGWGPRAMLFPDGEVIGHAGFHGPPLAIDLALADPSYVGSVEPAEAGAVEFGYTVFPEHRGNGYATEALAGLIEWAFMTGDVSTFLATVSPANAASLAVLNRLGGFTQIGTCTDADGVLEYVYRRDRDDAAEPA